MAQYVNKFLVQHKKFGPAQNLLRPVKGQGKILQYYQKIIWNMHHAALELKILLSICISNILISTLCIVENILGKYNQFVISVYYEENVSIKFSTSRIQKRLFKSKKKHSSNFYKLYLAVWAFVANDIVLLILSEAFWQVGFSLI